MPTTLTIAGSRETPAAVDFKKTNPEQVADLLTTRLDELVGSAYNVQLITGDGAITNKEGIVVFTKGSAGAITLADPTATTDDGKRMICIAGSAQAHVITNAADGFNAKGSSGTVTYTAALGNSCTLVAHAGHWYVVNNTGVTVA